MWLPRSQDASRCQAHRGLPARAIATMRDAASHAPRARSGRAATVHRPGDGLLHSRSSGNLAAIAALLLQA
jgi:hypothetical protein